MEDNIASQIRENIFNEWNQYSQGLRLLSGIIQNEITPECQEHKNKLVEDVGYFIDEYEKYKIALDSCKQRILEFCNKELQKVSFDKPEREE